MLHYAVEAAFDDLLCCWRAHDAITRRPYATTIERGDARIALDRARNRMHRLRVAVYPSSDELEAVIAYLWCETLDMVVHLTRGDRDLTDPATYRCACGHRVHIDHATLAKRAGEPNHH